MQNDQALALKQPTPSSKTGTGQAVASLSAENFASFVLEHTYAVIWVSNGGEPSNFPVGIALQLGVFHAPSVCFGHVNLANIETTSSVKLYTRLGLAHLNLKPDSKGLPPTGFYLLASGTPIGFHDGNIDPSKDGDNLGPALFVGLLAALFTNDGEAGLKAGGQVMGLNVGERIVKKFSKLIKQHHDQSRLLGGGSDVSALQEEAEVRQRAYAVLGLSPQANLEKVKKAFEDRAKKLHENLNGLDTQSLQHRAAELQLAHQFIMNEHSRA
ncbi:J domain-containing protein [Melittangium boletus]|uniref:J domain-containing protein n=1 Tax=Melittangium boletus TaxID=83453 RepID=UPI003DA40E78